MSERIKGELALVAAMYGELEIDCDLRWFIIKQWRLIPGWNKEETRVLVLIPPGYAVTPPDNFYTSPDLAVKGGTQPPETPHSLSRLAASNGSSFRTISRDRIGNQRTGTTCLLFSLVWIGVSRS